MSLSVFNTVGLTAITITNVSYSSPITFLGVSLSIGDSHVFRGNDIERIKKLFDTSSSNTAILNSGAVTIEAVQNLNPSSGIDRLPVNGEIIYITVGAPGVEGCEFNFASAANETRQALNFGALIPRYCYGEWGSIKNEEACDADLALSLGTTASGVEFLSAVSSNVLGESKMGLSATNPIIYADAADKNVYLNAIPPSGTNWSAVTTGKWTVALKIGRVF